jgi:tetrahydrodipicolinate N-succinyltransferase
MDLQHFIDNHGSYTEQQAQAFLQNFLTALETSDIVIVRSDKSINTAAKTCITLCFKYLPMQQFLLPDTLEIPDWASFLFFQDKFTLSPTYKKTVCDLGKTTVSPGVLVRQGAFVHPSCYVEPCFINLGAHVGKHTHIYSFVTIGSCAKVGEHCILQSGVGLGGVLEPVAATPVCIGDFVYIGARSSIVEGVQVGEYAYIAEGVSITKASKIIDTVNNTEYVGHVPPYAVIIMGHRLKSEKQSLGESLGVSAIYISTPIIVGYGSPSTCLVSGHTDGSAIIRQYYEGS